LRRPLRVLVDLASLSIPLLKDMVAISEISLAATSEPTSFNSFSNLLKMELFVFVPDAPNVPKHLPAVGQPCFIVERDISRLTMLLKFSHSITGETAFVPILYNYGTKHMSAWDPSMQEDVTSVKDNESATRILDQMHKVG
jgi:hypothetical protein